MTISPENPVLAMIRELKSLTGIHTADCWSCAHSAPDFDGDPGDMRYCGTVCSRRREGAPYVEDSGIDPDKEQLCWEPNYWMSTAQSPFGRLAERACPIRGCSAYEDVERNRAAWNKAVAPYLRRKRLVEQLILIGPRMWQLTCAEAGQ